MLTDERFAGNLLGGSLSTRDALDEVLYTDPPMANFCMTYPRQPILVDDAWLPAHRTGRHQHVRVQQRSGHRRTAISSTTARTWPGARVRTAVRPSRSRT